MNDIMMIFSEKLTTLSETVRLVANGPIVATEEALRRTAGRPAIAIGSGGSAIMAQFFARCRSTLGHGITLIQTPMDFVVSQDDLSGHDVWIFSASADNPDTDAALSSALSSCASSVTLITVNAHGTAAIAASEANAQLIVVPVAERKDGFLATHSLIAMVTCVLAAAERISGQSRPQNIVHQLAEEVDRIASSSGAVTLGFRPGDTVFVLHDPQCRTLATLLDTSLWETAIAPVQCSDFRNFAHGRHVWAARHEEKMFILSITSAVSQNIWANIRDALPSSVRSINIDLGHAGRFRTALSIAEGLGLVHAFGKVAGIDPAKPGTGIFATTIYSDTSLADLARKFQPAVKHKLRAVHLHDDPACPSIAATTAHETWVGAVSAARIGGVVLDYSGARLPGGIAWLKFAPVWR